MAKLNFQHHYSSVQYHMILHKSFQHPALMLRKRLLLLSILKLSSFFFSILFDEKKIQKNSIYLKYKAFVTVYTIQKFGVSKNVLYIFFCVCEKTLIFFIQLHFNQLA